MNELVNNEQEKEQLKNIEIKKVLYESESGGFVKTAYENIPNEECENFEASKILANYGKKIILLPSNNGYMQRTADALIDDEYWEIKTNYRPTKSAIDNELRKAKTQAKNVIINIKSEISNEDLFSAVKGRIRRTDIEKIVLIRNEKFMLLKKSEI